MDFGLLAIQAILILIVAFVYSNLGLGGGILFVPILLSTGVASSHVAVPISLMYTIATATSSVINHRKRGFVDFRLGKKLVAGALIGAVLGTFFTLFVLDEQVFKALFTAILVLFGTYMLLDWARNDRAVDTDDDSKLTPSRTAGEIGRAHV